jgi:hypothetical protein
LSRRGVLIRRELGVDGAGVEYAGQLNDSEQSHVTEYPHNRYLKQFKVIVCRPSAGPFADHKRNDRQKVNDEISGEVANGNEPEALLPDFILRRITNPNADVFDFLIFAEATDSEDIENGTSVGFFRSICLAEIHHYVNYEYAFEDNCESLLIR